VAKRLRGKIEFGARDIKEKNPQGRTRGGAIIKRGAKKVP